MKSHPPRAGQPERMPTYTRKYTRHNLKTREVTSLVETYEQPRLDRLRYRAFKGLWRVTLAKPLHYLIDGPLDRLAYRVHRATCNDDCVGGESRSSLADEWVKAPMCGYVPLCARLDLKLYDLDTRRNTRLTETRQA